jgi:hypothetical protein
MGALSGDLTVGSGVVSGDGFPPYRKCVLKRYGSAETLRQSQRPRTRVSAPHGQHLQSKSDWGCIVESRPFDCAQGRLFRKVPPVV